MSGPIEYAVVISAARAAIIQARRAAESAERKARTKARLAEQRAAAAQRAANTRSRLAKRRAAAKEHYERAKTPSGKEPSVDAHISNSDPALTDSVYRNITQDQIPATVEVSTIQRPAADEESQVSESRFQETSDQPLWSSNTPQEGSLEQLLAWHGVLTEEEAVAHFRREAATAWMTKAETLITDFEADRPAGDLLRQIRNLITDAETIHEQAGEDQAKFANRNELLQDIIQSLQEIGYFVKDPILSDPADPTGPVLVTAIRGEEEMVATVDFSETIRSIWNGSETDHCKYAFFEYLDRMKTRGIDVSTKRTDLQVRPKLRQKGAKQLPRDDSQHR